MSSSFILLRTQHHLERALPILKTNHSASVDSVSPCLQTKATSSPVTSTVSANNHES